MNSRILLVFGVLLQVLVVHSFDTDEFEIFDLVEEVNQNFYDFLEVEQTATTNEIKKAYRRLSLVLHPDKNKAEDAEVKFRWLASIYDTLRDPEKRKVYDRVLVEGLPDWRTPVFYYRRMRKIGLAEGLTYLILISSFIQYAMHWASYFERKFTLSENIGDQLNKRSTQKKLKKAKNVDVDQDKIMQEHLESLGVVKPSVWDLLPFQIVRLTKATVLALPSLPGTIYAAIKEHREAQEAIKKREIEEQEEIERREQEKKERKEKLRQRKLATPKYEERDYGNQFANDIPTEKQEKSEFVPRNARQLWTDDQLNKLCKLMKKYPGGTQDRWEIIAEAMERYPWEITKMAANVKGTMYQAPSQTAGNKVPGLQPLVQEDSTEDSESDYSDESSDTDQEELGYTLATKNDYVPVEVKTKTKTRKNQPEEEAGEAQEQTWTQIEQKTFEQAIKQFPKGTPERWERIAAKVPGKSVDDCIQRFKYLAQMVKAKKEESL